MIELLETALGKKAIIERKPLQPGDIPFTYANIDKARMKLGYDPKMKIDQGIRQFADWIRQSEF